MKAAVATRYGPPDVVQVTDVPRPATEGSHDALANILAARIDASSDVLVDGATGAIGSAAVQIIKGIGAPVAAVCSSEHVDLVAGLGADRVVDHCEVVR